ncbi:MAG: hypothetical protein IMZ52_03585 [Actinobacteria bacterium]|nr:hypothetical protein [Actinomycetota bacterium]MBE3114602.1 hypothetical protein [Actinomycetota bacterium]
MNWATGGKSYTLFGMADFSMTFDRGVIEQDLIGVAGNYKDQGALSIDGSLTISKLDTAANSDFLNNILDGTGINKYFAVSANVGGTLTDDTYLKFVFVSGQVTGWDTTAGDASTITEASIDFITINPQSVTYKGGMISDCKPHG